MNSVPLDPQKSQASLPKHIAVIMDGNGRWALARGQKRIAGHKAGVASARVLVRACAEKGITVLTLFAFGQENWQRPEGEVSYLHTLLRLTLQREVAELVKNNIRLCVIGDLSALQPKIQQQIASAVARTQDNTGMQLVIAFNYSGHWDITRAARRLAVAVSKNELDPQAITQSVFAEQLSTNHLPAPDLLIRTSGEYRLSNFLLWELAYTELYFTAVYWPDFTKADLEEALQAFALRERRFGNIDN